MEKKKSFSLSVIVPSYNEEENLEATIQGVSKILEGTTDDYEFIIVNDCSTDKTAEIADRLMSTNSHVRVHHNAINQGLGYTYRKGVQLAKNDFVILVPGDNEVRPESVRDILGSLGSADIILSYPENVYLRPWLRQVLSLTYTAVLNWISGYQVAYYNGLILYRRKVLQGTTFVTNGFAFQAEILVQLLKQGYSFHQVPFKLNYSSSRLTALRIKNVVTVIYTVCRLAMTYRLNLIRPKKPRDLTS
jgi:glycosyltransferase involved in cell wall biosynthesis